MKKVFIFGLLISLVLVSFTSPSFAALANSKATLDVSSVLGTSGITWATSSFSTSATAYVEDTSMSLGPTTNPISTWGSVSSILTTAPAKIEAAAGGTATPSTLTSLAKADTTSAELPYSYAITERSGEFTANATGYVTFTLPFVLSYDLHTAAGNSMAYGYAEVMATLTRTSGSAPYPTGGYDLYKADLAYDGLTLIYSTATDPNADKQAIVQLYLQQGDTAKLTLYTKAETAAAAPVPIPAAFWLLGSGLVGLIGIRRKKG